MIPYTAPVFEGSAFNCPHCGAYANQRWFDVNAAGARVGSVPDLKLAICVHCQRYSLWRGAKMLYPSGGGAPLPDDIRADYEEARAIVSLSPRGAAALLRLAIQKLCIHLGEPGENLNTDIANLVKRGLPGKVQKALDIVRVIGNEAVHPGQIDLKDDKQTANELFHLLNLIAEVMITQPKHVDELYESLPESKREAIRGRDAQP